VIVGTKLTGSALTFAYTYNLADALVQTTYPSFGDSRGSRTVTNSYDVANRVVGVTGALGGTSTPYVAGACSSGICYAASGAPSGYTYNNGVARSYSYNSLLQPTAMTDTLSGTTLFSLGYTFGATGANNGNPTQVAIGGSGAGAGFTQNYGYDKLNRLCAAGEATGAVSISSCTAPTTGVNWAQNLSYDRYGNMWAPTASQAGVSGIPALGWMPTSSSQINAANNQLAVSGLNYDSGGGNQTTFLGTSTTSPIQYDAENRQVQVVTGSSTTYTYSYDGLGQRVSRTVGGATTDYVHDVFGNLAAEYNPPTAAACTTCYLSWDHLGSTRMVTDGSGNVIARHDYLPYGVEIPNGVAGRSGVWAVTDGLSPKFTGQDHDAETFLEFYQARYLAAGLGRFMSVDPGNAGADLGDPQTWNMYGYVRNNPLVFVDPDGMDATAEDCIYDPESCEAGDGTWDTGGGWGWGGGGASPPNPGTISPVSGPQTGPGTGGVGQGSGFLGPLIPTAAGTGTGITIAWGGGWSLETIGGTICVLSGLCEIGAPVILTVGAVAAIGAGAYAIVHSAKGNIAYANRVKPWSQAGQESSLNRAKERYRRECGKSLTPPEERRLHDVITKQGLGSDEVFEEMVSLFGCSGKQGPR
jgi:RHS repeat-associated protein